MNVAPEMGTLAGEVARAAGGAAVADIHLREVRTALRAARHSRAPAAGLACEILLKTPDGTLGDRRAKQAVRIALHQFLEQDQGLVGLSMKAAVKTLPDTKYRLHTATIHRTTPPSAPNMG